MNTVNQLEAEIQKLSFSEQVWLLERLAHHIRIQTDKRQILDSDLAAMAADLDIQREIRAIDEEFRATESDGLADL
jgi:hypothetical protein